MFYQSHIRVLQLGLLLAMTACLCRATNGECRVPFLGDGRLESPFRLKGSAIGEDRSFQKPTQTLTWDIEVAVDLYPTTFYQQGDVSIYDISVVQGHIRLKGTLVDNDPDNHVYKTANFHKEYVFLSESPFGAAFGTIQYSGSQRRITTASIALPSLLHGPDDPVPTRVMFNDIPINPPPGRPTNVPDLIISINFPDFWRFDATYHLFGESSGIKQYLIWMAGAGRATDQQINDRVASLERVLHDTDVVAFKPSGPRFPGIGSIGYTAGDVNEIKEFIKSLKDCGIPAANLHFMASSAGVEPFENGIYNHLPTLYGQASLAIGGVFIVQPFCPRTVFDIVCAPRNYLQGTVKPLVHVVFDIQMSDKLQKSVGAGPSRFFVESGDNRWYIVWNHGCGEKQTLWSVVPVHAVAVGESESLAQSALTSISWGLTEQARALLDNWENTGGRGTPDPPVRDDICDVVNVPNVVGSSKGRALEVLAAAGLVIGPLKYEHGTTFPSDTVLSQVPAAGTDIAVGSVVELSLSAGPLVNGDVNGDGKVDCGDTAIVQARLGKKAGMPDFDARADVVKDNVIDVRDLAFVSKLLPAGTRCK